MRTITLALTAVLSCLCLDSARAQWTISAADTAGLTGYRSHLALDASGSPHVAYTRMEPFALLYAWRSASGAWETETVDAANGSAESFYNALALDGRGLPHIAYSSGAGHLNYASRDSAGTWTIRTVDADSLVGKTPSLALTSETRAVISYFDERRGRLKLAVETAVGWTLSVLDSTGVAGWDTALALDARELPHIAYHERVTGQLRYIVLGSPPQVVDEPGPFPSLYNTSLALDAAGMAHISYLDAAHLDLRYAAQRSGGAWALESPDTTGETGGHTSLALDHQGLPHISYHDRTHGDLRYASRAGDGTWTLETVDGVADSVGEMTSLALDAQDGPRITYLAKVAANLDFAEGPRATGIRPPSPATPRLSLRLRAGVLRITAHIEEAAEDLRVDAFTASGCRVARWDVGAQPAGPLDLALPVPRDLPAGLLYCRMRDGHHLPWSGAVVAGR